MTIRHIASLAVALLLSASTGGFAEPQVSPLRQFKSAVRDYVALHQRLEQQLPPLRLSEDEEEIFEASDALADAIQTARAAAREGDIFTPPVAAYIRVLIADRLTARGFLPEELVSAMLEDADESSPPAVVNGRFPWGRGTIMWPFLLEALPHLPHELQYRMIGRDLVLVDTHADLVVDIMRNAIR
jgi:hypothetical protein